MRALYYLPIFVALVACEPDVEISPATVEWMEWPAEVPAATPFSVRLIVSRTCLQGTFQPGISADESAVTFEPYWLIERNAETACLPEARQFDIYYVALDTVGTAPGLAADFARTFEMRAAAAPLAGAKLPVRTYGDVTVRPSNPDGAAAPGPDLPANCWTVPAVAGCNPAAPLVHPARQDRPTHWTNRPTRRASRTRSSEDTSMTRLLRSAANPESSTSSP